MVCTWFGELCYCSPLPVLPCPTWVLLRYVLQTIFLFVEAGAEISTLTLHHKCHRELYRLTLHWWSQTLVGLTWFLNVPQSAQLCLGWWEFG